MTRAQDYMTGVLRRIGHRAFRADDEFAREHGWQITPGRLGLTRTYRHPGFSRLASCADCHGSGLGAHARCDHCSGTGRVTLGEFESARG
jgi:hypothetical protein